MEEGHSLFGATQAAMDEAEVGDDLSFVLFVAELSKDGERLLEVLNCCYVSPFLSESEREVVERQRLGVLIAEVTDDCQRDSVLFGSLMRVASTSELRSALVEPERVAAPAQHTDVKDPRRKPCQPVRRDGVRLTHADQKKMGALGGAAGHVAGATSNPAHVSSKTQLAKSRAQASNSPLDRIDRNPQLLSDRKASQQPDPGDCEVDEQQHRKRDQRHNDEGKRQEQSTRQEPQPRQGEQPTAKTFPICHHRRVRNLSVIHLRSRCLSPRSRTFLRLSARATRARGKG